MRPSGAGERLREGISSASDGGGCRKAAFRVYVEDVTHCVEVEVQIALAHELFIPLVARVFLCLQLHPLGPIGVRKARPAHERLTLATESDNAGILVNCSKMIGGIIIKLEAKIIGITPP